MDRAREPRSTWSTVWCGKCANERERARARALRLALAMKRVKKKLSLSRETIRPLENAKLRDAHGAVIASISICVPCPPPTGQTMCKSCFNSDCCLATQQDPDLCLIR